MIHSLIFLTFGFGLLSYFTYKKNLGKGLSVKVISYLCEKKIIPPYTEIIENLWLGNYVGARDIDFLRDNNIKLVINLSKNIPNVDLDIDLKLRNKINFYRVPINDDLSIESDEGMIKHFDKLYELIDYNLEKGNGVFIHCYAGMQRSATIVALYLMKKRDISFKLAEKLIKSKRDIVFFPFAHFKKVINYFSKIWDL